MKTFSSKILLFGEYSVINGGPALSVPFRKFGGQWRTNKPTNYQWAEKLYDFGNYAQNKLDIQVEERFFKSLQEGGLWFDSNIPTGYGLGSSGALCAAFYKEYVLNPLNVVPENLGALKSILSSLECFFHGSSSGLDPLTSYCNQGLHIQKDEISIVSPSGVQGLFLYNSQLSRETKPLVHWYLETYKEQQGYTEKLNFYINNAVAPSIKNYILGDSDSFKKTFQQISEMQIELFSKMIPDALRVKWKSDSHQLKLCGAGGGGFFIGLSSDMEQTESILGTENIISF